MSRPILAAAVVAWIGLVLVLSEVRWFARVPLVERLRPYTPTSRAAGAAHLRSSGSLRDVVGSLVQDVGERISHGLGIHDDLSTRLARIGAASSPAEFRLRQLAWSGAALVAAAAVVVASAPPVLIGVLFLLGAPALAFLVLDHRLEQANRAHQRQLVLELPVVTEQLGMCLAAGYSLGGAIDRLARRGNGVCAQSLARVALRSRHGLSDIDALREWADLADVPALHHLVAVLALHRDAGDLGHLISEEARSMRRDVHRELIETIERRAQQVWIPVTVATLLPGALFLAVPFIEAMRLYGGA
ncbi:MAG: type II secretion system F family protein [Acidimicrobiales bacterium]|jgi:Flp pilus assembly protein TadB|nr:type II secretion system F family protein [Acidimicrobiales bacterium]